MPRTSPFSSSVFHTASALSAPSGHLPLEGKGDRAAVDRVLSYIVDLRRSSSIFFIPLPPSNLRPFGAPPSIGRRECPREPLPLEGAAERSEAGLAYFLGSARVLVYRLLETISPLFFIPLVPYPPLRGTFPLRGRLYVGDSDARVYDALETIFSLSFIPPVPYPPLRGTFPSRGRLCSSALVFLRILYSLWRYRLMAYHASILRKQKPLCEDGL